MRRRLSGPRPPRTVVCAIAGYALEQDPTTRVVYVLHPTGYLWGVFDTVEQARRTVERFAPKEAAK